MALTNNDIQTLANLIDTKLDQKLQPINNELVNINSRLDKMDSRLDGMDSRLDGMDNRLDGMDSRLDKMDIRLDKMDIRLDKIESEVSALHANQIEFNKELKKLDRKVSDTYELALEAWGTSTENRMWLESDKLKV